MIIKCRKIARKILADMKDGFAARVTKRPRGGAIACIGWEGCNRNFGKQLIRAAQEVGIEYGVRSVGFCLGADTSSVLTVMREYAEDEICGGIVIVQPLPDSVSGAMVLDAIPMGKDIDCARHENREGITDVPSRPFMPPAVGAARSVFKKLRLTSEMLQGKRVVLVGKGFSICRPIYLWFLGHVESLEIIDTKTEPDEKSALLKNADIVVCGAATDKVLVTGEMIRLGTVVLDYGAPTPNADVASIDAAGGIVARGMGPLVIAHMLKNYLILNSGVQE